MRISVAVLVTFLAGLGNLKDEGIPVTYSGSKLAGFNVVKEGQAQDVEGAGLNDTKP